MNPIPVGSDVLLRVVIQIQEQWIVRGQILNQEQNQEKELGTSGHDWHHLEVIVRQCRDGGSQLTPERTNRQEEQCSFQQKTCVDPSDYDGTKDQNDAKYLIMVILYLIKILEDVVQITQIVEIRDRIKENKGNDEDDACGNFTFKISRRRTQLRKVWPEEAEKQCPGKE